jgi:hypothetical protein
LFVLSGNIWQNGSIYGNNSWKQNDVISIEIDTNRKTLHVFVNNILQPVSVCDVTFPLKGRVWLLIIYLSIFIDLS